MNNLERERKETLLNSEADIKLKEDKMDELVKGFKDYAGIDAIKREAIKEILIKNFRLYGFEPAETPVIEYEEFVKAGNENSEAISDIFKLQDKGKRNLALIYEFTFQLKRISKNMKLPYKRYQIGYVFRDEPTSSNRVRQITQCDVDIVGSKIRDEAEILALASRILDELKIEAIIYFNSRKLLNEILDEQKISDKESVMREIDKLDKIEESEVKKNLKKLKAEKVLAVFKKPESYFKKYASYKDIEDLRAYCRDYGIKIEFQPSLVRGLGYYTGTVFEIKTKDMRESILGGGSYVINNLQATGMSFGLERLSQIAKLNISEKRIVIISIGKDKESIELAEGIRGKGLQCSVYFNKVSKALEYANSYSIPFVIFLGEDEVKKKKFKLRDMKSGKEEMLTLSQITERLKL
jgi:histidyl-tRNA synthetase